MHAKSRSAAPSWPAASSVRHQKAVPADDDQDRRDQVRRVAEELKRQLGEKRADPAGEVRRRGVRAGAEEPDRVGRLVAGERDDPDERGRKERDADELADAARNGRSTHVSDLHDDGQHEGPPSRTFAEEAAQLHAQLFLDQSLIGPLFEAGLLDDLGQQARGVGEQRLAVLHDEPARDDVGHAFERPSAC